MHHHFIDRYAREDSVIHRLDARTKLLTAIVFSAYVVSIPRYEIAPLVPLVIIPFTWITLGKIPWPFVGKHILICSPFILTLAVFNPLFDHSLQHIVLFGSRYTVPGGFLIAINLLVKYLLGITCLIALSSTTRFDHLLLAMKKFRVPRILILQMYFLYRYLFELIEQGHEILRARQARDVGHLTVARRIRSSSGMVGVLFIRSYESALKVFQAMEARLYDGHLRTVEQLQFTRPDLIAFIFTAGFLFFCYLSNT
ncbi:MAG: cobalt ECF transporter T component CbiQ [Phycisphaerae bacterium]